MTIPIGGTDRGEEMVVGHSEGVSYADPHFKPLPDNARVVAIGPMGEQDVEKWQDGILWLDKRLRALEQQCAELAAQLRRMEDGGR